MWNLADKRMCNVAVEDWTVFSLVFFNFFKYVCTYDFYQLSLGKKYNHYLHEGGSGSTTD